LYGAKRVKAVIEKIFVGPFFSQTWLVLPNWHNFVTNEVFSLSKEISQHL